MSPKGEFSTVNRNRPQFGNCHRFPKFGQLRPKLSNTWCTLARTRPTPTAFAPIPELAESRPNPRCGRQGSGQTRPPIRPNSARVGRHRPTFDPALPKLVELGPLSDERHPNSAKLGPTFHEFASSWIASAAEAYPCWAESPQWPTLAQTWSKQARDGRLRLKFGRIPPNVLHNGLGLDMSERSLSNIA